MADNNYRSSRRRDPLPRGESDLDANAAASDPLAELARLIGQGEPSGADGVYEQPGRAPSAETATASSVDWGADAAYADDYGRTDNRAVGPSADPYAAMPQDRGQEQDYTHEDEPLSGRYFPGPAQKLDGSRADEVGGARADYASEPDELPPVAPGRHLPMFASPAYDDRLEREYQEQDGEQYPENDYEDGAARPRRRGAIAVVMAVLGLAVLGTAGAFGYRAMFGRSVLPTLPPIIKASVGPNKIVPNTGHAKASNSGAAAAAGAGSSVSGAARLAPPAEKPVDIHQSVQTAPRVVSTIPIVASASPVPPVAATAGQPPGTAPSTPSSGVAGAPPAPAAAAATQPAAVPATAPPPQTAKAAPAAAPAALGPKSIHTVIIHADQQRSDRTAATGSPARRHRASTTVATRRADRPLSIMPGAGDDSTAPREHGRRGTAPMALASAEPTNTTAASGGGYAVQVTSQRTAAQAKAAFRALRGRYPHQFGGRAPIIHRVDLGAKGTYYRALVGPFASVEAAAQMCSSLKAAGGNCLIQRN